MKRSPFPDVTDEQWRRMPLRVRLTYSVPRWFGYILAFALMGAWWGAVIMGAISACKRSL